MPDDQNNDYLLTSDDGEMMRLRLQAQVWEPAATEFLEALNIKPGMRVLDLGCGAMGVLRPLSRLVGDSGEVLGLDRDPALLASARQFVAEEKLENVALLEGDAFATGLPSGQFDLVHARFLLAPLGRPGQLVDEMLRLVRPGGIIALQEPDASCWNVSPADETWSALKNAILAAFTAKGSDFDVGRLTYGLLRERGVEQVAQRNAVLALTGQHPYKMLPAQFAASLYDRILEGGHLDEASLDAAIEQVWKLAADPDTVMTSFIVTQVSGRRSE